MVCLERFPREYYSIVSVCKIAFEKTTRLLEQWSLWPEEAKLEIFGHSHVWKNLNILNLNISTNIPHQLSSTVRKRWWFGLVWQPQDLGTCGHGFDLELLCIPKYSMIRCGAICLTGKAWPRLGDKTRPWSQVWHQIYKRLAETEVTVL